MSQAARSKLAAMQSNQAQTIGHALHVSGANGRVEAALLPDLDDSQQAALSKVKPKVCASSACVLHLHAQ